MKQSEKETEEIFWDFYEKREPIVLEELVGLSYGIIASVLMMSFFVVMGIAVVSFNLVKYSKGRRKR
jgi:hypothetical protein